MYVPVFLSTFIIIPVFCVPSNEIKSVLFENLVKKCPNLMKSQMLKDCSNSTIEEISNITKANEKNVLCTIYLLNMKKFVDTFSVEKDACNDLLLFPSQENNSQICEHPKFLNVNQTDKVMDFSFLCSRLCYNWYKQLDPKCSLAYYYYNVSSNNQKGKGQNDTLQIYKDNSQLLNNNTFKDKHKFPLLENDNINLNKTHNFAAKLNLQDTEYSRETNHNLMGSNKSIKTSTSSSTLLVNNSNKEHGEVTDSNNKEFIPLTTSEIIEVMENGEDTDNSENEFVEVDGSTSCKL